MICDIIVLLATFVAVLIVAFLDIDNRLLDEIGCSRLVPNDFISQDSLTQEGSQLDGTAKSMFVVFEDLFVTAPGVMDELVSPLVRPVLCRIPVEVAHHLEEEAPVDV